MKKYTQDDKPRLLFKDATDSIQVLAQEPSIGSECFTYNFYYYDYRRKFWCNNYCDEIVNPKFQWVYLEDVFKEANIKCGEYTISEHPKLPDGREVIWIENKEGEGTTVGIKELFRRYF